MDFTEGSTDASGTPVDHALDQLRAAAEHLVKAVEDGGLDHYDVPQLLGFVAEFEQVRNLTSSVDHRVVADCDRRQVADQLNARTTKALLVSLLRISEADAGRRVRAAAAVGNRMSMHGLPLGPLRPVLATAARVGEVNGEQVAIIEQVLEQVDRPGFDPADIRRAERDLTEYAKTFAPRDLRRIAVKLLDTIDPDGSLPNDDVNHDRRHVLLTANRDGSYTLAGRLTGVLGASLQAVLSPLAKPRVDSPGHDGDRYGHEDSRTYGQRMHDALDDVCARLLRAGGLPVSGGTPATVIVTISADDLLAGTGHGETSDSTLISTARLLELAGEADILPAVLTASGECLSLGRSRRIASTAQTFALIARDGGCSFPGCSHPPEWCDRHHIRAWIDGGTTDLDNLTLLCRYHHTRFEGRGWTCRMREGTPEWVPPRWVDRQQRALINPRIRRRQLSTTARQPGGSRPG